MAKHQWSQSTLPLRGSRILDSMSKFKNKIHNFTNIFFVLFLSACTFIDARNESQESEILSKEKEVLLLPEKASKKRDALAKILKYESPAIEARFLRVKADGDDKLHCSFKFEKLKLAVSFTEQKYVGSSVWSSASLTPQQLHEAKSINTPNKAKCNNYLLLYTRY